MTILPVNPTDNATPEALRAFLEQCAAVAAQANQPQLVSISMAVDSLDPLAVLESIFEPSQVHFYAERPAQGFGVAGAEAMLQGSFTGPARFAEAKAFIEQTLKNTIAVGPVGENFGGPHFFLLGGFAHDAPRAAPFPPLRVFVPRWQVSRMGDGSVAVANVFIGPGLPLDAIAEKLWKAHAKFRAFDNRTATNRDRPSAPKRIEEMGPAGGYQAAVAQALKEIARGDYE